MSKEKVYAIYKGDKFIDLGTKKELAEKLNVKPETIGFLTTPIYKKRRGKNIDNALIAIRIEDDE